MATRSGRAAPGLLLLAAVGTVLSGGMASRYGTSWPRRLHWPKPPGIVIHHSASPSHQAGKPVDAALIDRWHESQGWGQETASGNYHIGYHYVVLADGTVEPGRPEWMRGAHAVGYNDWLGVCLVGNFSSSENPNGAMGPSRPTPAQLDALHSLLKTLMAKYDLKPGDITRHRDVGQTACPGDRFPFALAVERLELSLGSARSRP